jgi:hypothetical protein
MSGWTTKKERDALAVLKDLPCSPIRKYGGIEVSKQTTHDTSNSFVNVDVTPSGTSAAAIA